MSARAAVDLCSEIERSPSAYPQTMTIALDNLPCHSQMEGMHTSGHGELQLPDPRLRVWRGTSKQLKGGWKTCCSGSCLPVSPPLPVSSMHVPRPEIWRELRSGCRTSGVCPCGPLSSRWGDWLYPKEGFMTFGSLADVWYLAHACQSKAQTSRFNPFGDLSGSSGPLQPETGRSWAKSRTGAERKERNPGTLKHDVVYGIYTYIIIYNHTYALMWACLKLGCPKIWWVDHHTHSSHKTRHSRSFPVYDMSPFCGYTTLYIHVYLHQSLC